MHVSGTQSHRRPAFTLVELLVVITIIVLLVAILLPSLSSSMARAKRVACLSSMKQTTFGLNMFAEEHANRYPWAVKAAEGGPAPSEFVYPYFAAAAGELRSPKIVVCASDGDRKKATSWSANPGGLASAGFQDSSVSYQIGLEAVKNVRGMLLLADRDLKGANGNCGIINYMSSGIVTTGLGGNATWTGKLHRGGGNISLADGSVQMVDNKQLSVVLKDQMNSAADPNLSNCTLKPGGTAAQGAVVP